MELIKSYNLLTFSPETHISKVRIDSLTVQMPSSFMKIENISYNLSKLKFVRSDFAKSIRVSKKIFDNLYKK